MIALLLFNSRKASKLSKSIVSSTRQFQHANIVRVCHERFFPDSFLKKHDKKHHFKFSSLLRGDMFKNPQTGHITVANPEKTALNIVVFVGPKMTPKGAWIGPPYPIFWLWLRPSCPTTQAFSSFPASSRM